MIPNGQDPATFRPTAQQDPVVENKPYLLYRYKAGVYALLFPDPMIYAKPRSRRDHHVGRLSRALQDESGSWFLQESFCYLPTVDILVSAEFTPTLLQALEHRLRAQAEEAERVRAQQVEREFVMNHPLYVTLAEKAKQEQLRREELELKLAEAEKLWGVDAILILDDECPSCFGRGKARPDDEDVCLLCDGTGDYYSIAFRSPGEFDADFEPFCNSSIKREALRIAYDKCAERGWKIVLDVDGRRRKIRYSQAEADPIA